MTAPTDPTPERIYAERDAMKQGAFYLRHVNAMTAEGLHSKSDIAAELAHRDIEIAQLRARLDAAAAAPGEPVAWPEWMRDREKLNDLRQHLVDAGWREGADGPLCFDQGAAMAAEVCDFVLKLLDALPAAQLTAAHSRDQFEEWWNSGDHGKGYGRGSREIAWMGWQAARAGAAVVQPQK